MSAKVVMGCWDEAGSKFQVGGQNEFPELGVQKELNPCGNEVAVCLITPSTNQLMMLRSAERRHMGTEQILLLTAVAVCMWLLVIIL